MYDATNFTVGGLSETASAITLNVTQQTALPVEYWQGGFNGGNNVWSVSDGSGNSNWSSTQSLLTTTSLVPGPSTIADFSQTSSSPAASQQGSTVLGVSMSVAGIAVQDPMAVSLNADGNTLTIGASGIAVSSGAGSVTIGVPVIMSGAQSWSNASGNALTVSGAVNNGGNLLTVTGAGNTNISGSISGAGGLTQAGSGTTTLSGVSSYGGATNLTAGTLLVSGSLSGTSAVNLDPSPWKSMEW